VETKNSRPTDYGNEIANVQNRLLMIEKALETKVLPVFDYLNKQQKVVGTEGATGQTMGQTTTKPAAASDLPGGINFGKIIEGAAPQVVKGIMDFLSGGGKSEAAPVDPAMQAMMDVQKTAFIDHWKNFLRERDLYVQIGEGVVKHIAKHGFKGLIKLGEPGE